MDNTEKLTDDQKNTIRQALVNTARGLLGIPYAYGAEWVDITKKPNALDCSELTENVYLINKLHMPDGGQQQFNYTLKIVNPQPGDLAFFGKGGDITKIYHVGMFFDNLNIIEARGYDPNAHFETGKVILRSRQIWENYANFCGYRSHLKLV